MDQFAIPVLGPQRAADQYPFASLLATYVAGERVW
jgi:hypothetical protein